MEYLDSPFFIWKWYGTQLQSILSYTQYKYTVCQNAKSNNSKHQFMINNTNLLLTQSPDYQKWDTT